MSTGLLPPVLTQVQVSVWEELGSWASETLLQAGAHAAGRWKSAVAFQDKLQARAFWLLALTDAVVQLLSLAESALLFSAASLSNFWISPTPSSHSTEREGKSASLSQLFWRFAVIVTKALNYIFVPFSPRPLVSFPGKYLLQNYKSCRYRWMGAIY